MNIQIKKIRGGKRAVKILAAVLLLIFVMNSLSAVTVFAAETGIATLTVKQTFTKTGAIIPPSETFTYKLTPQQASSPMPAGSSTNGYIFTATGTNNINIGPIIFTSMGLYIYELRHITNPQPGYDYDQEIYTLMIYVDENLTVTVVVYDREGNKTTDIKYLHTYRLRPSDPNLMADPPVVKTVTGSPAVINTFNFRLAAVNLSNPMPAGSENGVKTIQIAGSGWGYFGTWSYTGEGTYYYKVSEINSGVRGYTYDAAVYTITDSVKAVNGELILNRVVTNSSNRQVTSLSFINIYTGDNITSPPVTPPPSTTTPPAVIFPPQPVMPPMTQPPTTTPPEPTINPPPSTSKPVPPPEPSTEPTKPTTDEHPEIPSIIVPIVPTDRPPENKPPEPAKHNPVTGSPQTGDESPTTLYMVFFFTAGIGALGSAGYLLADRRSIRKKGFVK